MFQVGSDESDFDEGPSNDGGDTTVISLSMIQTWREKLQNS